MSSIDRRTFLRGAGVCLALPLLEAMRPVLALAGAGAAKPRRMVCIETNMGIMPQFFFPDKPGRDFALRPTSKSSRRIVISSRCFPA